MTASMTESSLTEIERIVREVLAGLASGATVAAEAPRAPVALTGAGPSTGEAAGLTSEAPLAGGDVVVTARLVTLDHISNRLGTARRLVVPAHAIVTPAVCDELRRRNVALVRDGADEARPQAAIRLVLVAARTRQEPTALVAALAQEGTAVQGHTSDCLIAATDQLAGEVVKPATLGLLWTGHAAAGLCLANRHPGVRAVLATDVPGTIAAMAALGANVLVLSPASGTAFQQKQIVSDFCRGGVRVCPEALRPRLG